MTQRASLRTVFSLFVHFFAGRLEPGSRLGECHGCEGPRSLCLKHLKTVLSHNLDNPAGPRMLNGCLRLDMLRTKVEHETTLKQAKESQSSEAKKATVPIETFLRKLFEEHGYLAPADKVRHFSPRALPKGIFTPALPRVMFNAAQLTVDSMVAFMLANSHFMWGMNRASGRLGLVGELYGRLHWDTRKTAINPGPLRVAPAIALPALVLNVMA